jgi:hypothetical protein
VDQTQKTRKKFPLQHHRLFQLVHRHRQSAAAAQTPANSSLLSQLKTRCCDGNPQLQWKSRGAMTVNHQNQMYDNTSRHRGMTTTSIAFETWGRSWTTGSFIRRISCEFENLEVELAHQFHPQ